MPSVTRRDTIFSVDTVYVENDVLSVKDLSIAPVEEDTSHLYKIAYAFRTNLLLPLLNVGFELPLGNRWSVSADFYYPWYWRSWHSSSKMKNCMELLFADVEVRYWLGTKHMPGVDNWSYRLSGHSFGVFAGAGYFDIGKDYEGRQGEFFNLSVDYLYAMRLGKKRRSRLEFSLGVGYIGSTARKYRVYDREGHAYKTGKKENVQWIGPTKATVSLVIPIVHKIRKEVVL